MPENVFDYTYNATKSEDAMGREFETPYNPRQWCDERHAATAFITVVSAALMVSSYPSRRC